MKEQILAKIIEQKAPSYGSIPFWSWNDRLEPEELRRQIRRMKEIGMKGFFMHARSGLETEYMSDEWFACISACVDEAERLGMEAWSYDENGWPSGFAGGELLKDSANHAVFLRCETAGELPASDADILGVYILENGKMRSAGAKDPAPYMVIRMGSDAAYVDTMDASVTKKFLEATHEIYKERLPADWFGSVMPGFFTDEPQYYRWATPYSRTMPKAFAEKYGYPVTDALPALFCDFDGAEEYRYDYYRLCHELFIRNFIRVVYEWCDKNGIRLTGHALEESSLDGQMCCCGGVMPFYEYEHIPGIDYLGRGIGNALAPKQLGSVCAQLGKSQAISEMFGCCGWDVTPRELKRIAEMQYAGGVNLMCQHLYPYSIRGQRKRDYPCHYSEHNPWQGYMADFDRYFSRLGAALSCGEEYAPVLVLHPIRSAYLHYKRDSGGIGRQDEALGSLVRMLTEKQIPYHFGDETILAEHAEVDGAVIRVGTCVYSAVLLPECETIDSTTAKLLEEYLANGGKLCAVGELPFRVDGRKRELPFLRPNMTMDELSAFSAVQVRGEDGGSVQLHMMARRTSSGWLIYLVNPSENTLFNVRVTVDGCRGLELLSLDGEKIVSHPVRGSANGDSVSVLIDFPDSGSVLLSETGSADFLPEQPDGAEEYLCLPAAAVLVRLPENSLTLDRARLSTDGGEWTELRPVECIRDNLLRQRFSGMVALQFAFTLDFLPEKLLAVLEPVNNQTVAVNGTPVLTDGGYRFDRCFQTFDLAPYVSIGENTLTVTFPYHQRDEVYHVLYDGVSESLRNCLTFDCEIECAYLVGAFRVESDSAFVPDVRNSLTTEGGFRLTKQTELLHPANVVTDGYPFYGGELVMRSELLWRPGMPQKLRLGGRFAVCRAEINGIALGSKLFDDVFDLTGKLREGKNDLVLTVCNSQRNLLGPHHRPDPEPTSVGPGTFSYENEWNGTKCGEYLTRYSFVRFGVDTE